MSALLAAFRAAPEEDDHGLAVPTEVDPVSRPRVDAVFQDSRANALGVGHDASAHAVQCRRDLDRGLTIEAVKPTFERAATLGIDVLGDLDHCPMETGALPQW